MNVIKDSPAAQFLLDPEFNSALADAFGVELSDLDISGIPAN